MTNTVTVLAESTGFSAVNTIWVLLGAALVFFMQAGFAMVETCLLYTSPSPRD